MTPTGHVQAMRRANGLDHYYSFSEGAGALYCSRFAPVAP